MTSSNNISLLETDITLKMQFCSLEISTQLALAFCSLCESSLNRKKKEYLTWEHSQDVLFVVVCHCSEYFEDLGAYNQLNLAYTVSDNKLE